MIIRQKILKTIAYLYLAVPIMVFFIGWLKIYLGIIFLLILSVALVLKFQDEENDAAAVTICFPQIMTIVAVAMLWVYMSGIGGFVWQRADFHARNALLHDLIDYGWPVIFESGSGLVYYLTFFMIPALVGKVLGFKAAEVALYIISVAGVIIVFLLLVSYFTDGGLTGQNSAKVSAHKADSRAIILMIAITALFAGLNVIGQFIVFLKGKGSMSLDSIYGWSAYQYTPNNALLEWVFNQAIPAWIGTLLYLFERKRKDASAFILITMLMIPHTPFAAVGIVPIMLADIVMFRFRKLFSIPNILSAISVLLVYGAYFSCNTAVSNDSKSGLGLLVYSNKSFPYLLCVISVFLFVEVGAYAIVLWKRNCTNYLFVAAVVELLIIPFFRIGNGRDFMMRGSVPGLFILMVIIIDTIFDRKFMASKVASKLLILCLCIGGYSAVGDFILTVQNTLDPSIENVADSVHSMGAEYDQWFADYMGNTSYLAQNAKDRFFYKYLGRCE